MSRFLRILFVFIMFYECAHSRHVRELRPTRTTLGDDIDKASMKLLQVEYEEAADKNLISSPLGVFTLLSMYSAGAQGSISDEIVRALGAGSQTELLESYGPLNDRLSKMDASYFVMANKIYVSKDYSLNQEFANTAVRSFGSEVEDIDFKNTQQAVATINQWAEEKTQNNLQDPVPEDVIDANTVSALFNVIFFKGHWSVPFEVSETKDVDFYVDKSTTVKKPTMHLKQSLFYAESKKLDAKLIELPYKEKDFRMVVILPNEVEGLPSIVEKVSKNGVLDEIFSLEQSQGDIELYMPKFSIEKEFNLNEILPKIGVSKMFTDGASGILEGKAVKVSKAYQKAFIKIDEEGSTAGAVTGAGFVFLKYVPTKEVRVDHPFMFCILAGDKILFTGTFTH